MLVGQLRRRDRDGTEPGGGGRAIRLGVEDPPARERPGRLQGPRHRRLLRLYQSPTPRMWPSSSPWPEANTPGWWRLYGDRCPHVSDYVDLRRRGPDPHLEGQFVPGLLQTDATCGPWSMAPTRGPRRGAGPAGRLRMARQTLLTGSTRRAVAVVTRPPCAAVGGREVMPALERLLERPAAHLHPSVLPFAAGAPGHGRPFSICASIPGAARLGLHGAPDQPSYLNKPRGRRYCT